MSDYIGELCPVCENAFTPNDDIVVCPICGTPHHRACYKANGECANEKMHSGDFSWKPKKNREEAEKTAAEEQDAICPVCGKENLPGSRFCSECGTQFGEGDWNGAYSVGMQPTVISDGELIDGVPAGDVRKFVGKSADMYVPLFYVMKKYGRKLTLNFVAFLFHGIWFITRKLYGKGILILLIMIATQLARGLILAAYPQFTDAQAAAVKVFSVEWVMQMVLSFSEILRYIIMLLCGFFGTNAYMNSSLKRIKKYNRSSSDVNEFNSKLLAKGSVSYPAAIIATSFYLFAEFVILKYSPEILEFLKKVIDFFL